MDSPINYAITVRAIIIDRAELFMVRHIGTTGYHALPGGHLESGEHLRAALVRELEEELGVTASVGNVLFINDWVGPNDHRVEFFFWVKNGASFRNADIIRSSHGHEITELLFGNPKDHNLLPSYLVDRFPRILELGNDYPTELVTPAA